MQLLGHNVERRRVCVKESSITKPGGVQSTQEPKKMFKDDSTRNDVEN